jgi:hypothetical protein
VLQLAFVGNRVLKLYSANSRNDVPITWTSTGVSPSVRRDPRGPDPRCCPFQFQRDLLVDI